MEHAEKNTLKVSVVIPAYNVGKFLPKCLDSVLAQTFSNLEVIVVDDGTPDDSGVIADGYAAKDSRVKVIHKTNGGVSAARNSGIDAATGDYICFVDGDDFVMPDYVEYMLDLALEHGADIALTTEMFGNFQEKQVDADHIRLWTPEDATEAILCYKVPIGCYCKIFRRDFLGADIRFIPEIFIGEGFNFNTAAFQRANKVAAGCRRTYYYRRDNPTSAMTRFNIKKCECGLWALEVIKENLLIRSERIMTAWNYANWRTHTDFYDMIVLAKAQRDYPEMYRRCREVTVKQARSAWKVPTSRMNRIRAAVMGICPELIPFAMILRKKKYRVNT